MATLDAIQFKLTGADELKAAFANCSDGMRRRVIKRAAEKGAQILVAPLRRATPKSKKGEKSPRNTARNPPGTLRKSTGRVSRKYAGGNVAAVYVGHRWPKGAAAHLVGLGTKGRYNKRGQYRGFVTPNPFFQAVYQANRSRVMAVVQGELSAGLQQEITKAARQGLQRDIKRDLR